MVRWMGFAPIPTDSQSVMLPNYNTHLRKMGYIYLHGPNFII